MEARLGPLNRNVGVRSFYYDKICLEGLGLQLRRSPKANESPLQACSSATEGPTPLRLSRMPSFRYVSISSTVAESVRIKLTFGILVDRSGCGRPYFVD